MELSKLKGFKEKRLQSLREEGINTPLDLINFFPIKYLDMTKITPLCEFSDGKEVLVKGVAITEAKTFHFSKVATTKATVLVEDKRINAMWFNQSYMKNNIAKDETYFFYGKLKISKNGISLLSPMFEKAENARRLFGVVTKYKKIENVPSPLISESVKTILEDEKLPSIITDDILDKYNLSSLKNAYYDLHFPPAIIDAYNALSRVFIEKAVRTMVALKVINKEEKNRLYEDYDLINELNKALPYKLTESQRKAVNEITTDIKSNAPMNRLLQGDVGSGKTIVAVAATLLNAKSGYQTVVLAPTVTLAMQHYNTFKEIFSNFGIEIGLACGNTKTSDVERKAESGEIKVVIGTHTLIQEDFKFDNLTLAVIDEQQKFGVSERGTIEQKGNEVDILSMTATPIPRTLSLLFCGELKVSFLDNERGEKNISTYIISERKIKDCFAFINDKIDKGGKAYIVAPKILDDDKTEKEGAISIYNEVKKYFTTRNIGLLHGRLNKKERERVTTDFISNKFDILVSTSVIEVGIDNKYANCMVIFGAENFGLSSLHQLRGRIGRNMQESYCFLVNYSVNENQKERLSFFKENTDGFKIADFDLKTRGAGDIFGKNQHGNSFLNNQEGYSYENLKMAKDIFEDLNIDMLDKRLIKEAKDNYLRNSIITFN